MGDFIERQLKRKRQAEKASRYAARYGGEGQLAMDLGFIPFGGHSVGKSDFVRSLAMAIASQGHIAGIDPASEGGGFSIAGRVPKENESNKTEDKMKTKKFYHTFEYENREVTLCLLVEEERQSLASQLRGDDPTATIKVGYAVCVPEDSFSEKLAKRISSGRAESDKARIEEFGLRTTTLFAFDLGILNATAKIYERQIKRGEVVIKGIRPTNREK